MNVYQVEMSAMMVYHGKEKVVTMEGEMAGIVWWLCCFHQKVREASLRDAWAEMEGGWRKKSCIHRGLEGSQAVSKGKDFEEEQWRHCSWKEWVRTEEEDRSFEKQQESRSHRAMRPCLNLGTMVKTHSEKIQWRWLVETLPPLSSPLYRGENWIPWKG